MNPITKQTPPLSRYVSLSAARTYTGLGRATVERIAKESQAVIRIGRRVVYDLNKIDAYMETLASK